MEGILHYSYGGWGEHTGLRGIRNRSCIFCKYKCEPELKMEVNVAGTWGENVGLNEKDKKIYQ